MYQITGERRGSFSNLGNGLWRGCGVSATLRLPITRSYFMGDRWFPKSLISASHHLLSRLLRSFWVTGFLAPPVQICTQENFAPLEVSRAQITSWYYTKPSEHSILNPNSGLYIPKPRLLEENPGFMWQPNRPLIAMSLFSEYNENATPISFRRLLLKRSDLQPYPNQSALTTERIASQLSTIISLFSTLHLFPGLPCSCVD